MNEEDERLGRFLEVVERIPGTWVCLDCGEPFPNHPGGVAPYAVRTKISPRGVRTIVGEICKACHDKPVETRR